MKIETNQPYLYLPNAVLRNSMKRCQPAMHVKDEKKISQDGFRVD